MSLLVRLLQRGNPRLAAIVAHGSPAEPHDAAAFDAASRKHFVDWLPLFAVLMSCIHGVHLLAFWGPGSSEADTDWRWWIWSLHLGQAVITAGWGLWARLAPVPRGASLERWAVRCIAGSYLVFTALSTAADQARGMGGLAFVLGAVGVATAVAGLAWARVVALGRWRQWQLSATVSRQAQALLAANQALGEEVARRAAAESELRELAARDPLTSLHNRRAFAQALAAAPPGTGLVVVDIDHFKRINDQFGHGAGDLAIVAVATELRAALRTDDTVARLGGEEFGAILPGLRAEELLPLCESLRAAVAALAIPGVPTPLTASVGATTLREDEAPEAAVTRADMALYAAKESGRDRVVVDLG